MNEHFDIDEILHELKENNFKFVIYSLSTIAFLKDR